MHTVRELKDLVKVQQVIETAAGKLWWAAQTLQRLRHVPEEQVEELVGLVVEGQDYVNGVGEACQVVLENLLEIERQLKKKRTPVKVDTGPIVFEEQPIEVPHTVKAHVKISDE